MSESMGERYKFLELNKRFLSTTDSLHELPQLEAPALFHLWPVVNAVTREVAFSFRSLVEAAGATAATSSSLNPQRLARVAGASSRRGVPLPDRVVFIILHSHTYHGVAVGRTMRTILANASRMLHSNSSVLAVVPVLIGLKVPEERSVTTDDSAPGDEAPVGAPLYFPNGGLYTLNGVIHGIYDGFTRMGDEMGTPHGPSLHWKAFVVSEGSFHVRTVRGMYPPVPSVCGLRGSWECEVVPYIVTENFRETEAIAMARYMYCRAIA